MRAIEAAIQQFFRTDDRDVQAVYLFGSRARGTAHSQSDIDVAILLARDPPRTMEGLCLDIGSDLERWLACQVDLVVLNRAPPDLVHRILRDGRLLVDENPSGRIQFENKLRNEYFDLQPILARCRGSKEPGP